MSVASTNGASTKTNESARATTSWPTTRVKTLDELVGAHPEALRAIYRGGKTTDPAELGEVPVGRVLALEPTREIHFVVKPLVEALRGGILPWKGKLFDGAGSGKNRVFGKEIVPFGYGPGTSEIDGGETLVIRYDRAEDGNVWPLKNIVDELRTVADGVAIGPALFAAKAGGALSVVLWFGLERAR